MSELKYKVGDKVLVEAKIEEEASYGSYPYRLRVGNATTGWVKKDELKKSLIDIKQKPKIPQAVMEFWERHKDSKWGFSEWFDFMTMPNEVEDWVFLSLQNQHALATLIAYGPEAVEVEREKRYRVYLVGVKNQWNQRQCLTNNEDNYFFSGRCMVDTTYTKQEIIKAGFGDVFDNPMFEVTEVE